MVVHKLQRSWRTAATATATKEPIRLRGIYTLFGSDDAVKIPTSKASREV